MKTIKKLMDVLPPEMQEAQALALDDYMDKDLVIHNCREVQGTHGTYMRIVVSLPESEDQFYLATGGSQPVEVLRYCKENRLFPVMAAFHRIGKAIILSS